MTSLRRDPDFLRLWSAGTISVFGTLITRTALPLAAILVLGAGALEVSFLRGLEIAAGLRATHYVNASGGRELYDAAAFARRGIELRFFDPYQGSDWSILYRLMTEDPSAVAKEIRSQS